MKKLLTILILAMATFLISCSDAQIASQNISKDAEMFRIVRRVVFFNGITDKYLLVIEGKCSVQEYSRKLTVTCKSPDGYKKHYLGLSDNVSYFIEQVKTVDANINHYKIIFKPITVLPKVELR